MENILPALKSVGERRYRETSGLYWEDFEPGDVFEHRPGRTVLDVDNVWFTLLTMNTNQVHFDAAYAAKTEWKKPLVDSTFTLALLTGMSVRTVSAKVVANLGTAEYRLSQWTRRRLGRSAQKVMQAVPCLVERDASGRGFTFFRCRTQLRGALLHARHDELANIRSRQISLADAEVAHQLSTDFRRHPVESGS